MKESINKYKFILLFILLSSFPFYCQVTIPSNCAKEAVLLYSIPECNKNAYELVLEDNFDGNKLDTSVWELPGSFQTALQGAGHIDYTTLDNIYVSNGKCYVTAKKETVVKRMVLWLDSNEILSDGLPNLRQFDYTSGGMWTKKTFFHGKFEARCRMPEGKGFWPALWMYGGIRGNEIDIFDSYAGTEKWVTNILHEFEGNGKLFGCHEVYNGYDLAQWHTFTCIFSFDKISFFIDGHLTRIIHRIVTSGGQPINCDDNIAAGTYYFLKSYPIEQMHMIINLSLLSVHGPPGSLAVDETTPLPSSFEIDYVKVWKSSHAEINLVTKPNPVADNLEIESNQRMNEIKIIDVIGNTLYNVKLDATEISIDLQGLGDGIYFIQVGFGENVKTKKIIKTTL